MGWKLSAIFIKPAKLASTEGLLEKLGIEGAERFGQFHFNEVLDPDLETISIGRHGDLLVLSSWEAVETCFSPTISKLEENILLQFPDSEIGVAALQSTVDFWGFSLIADGKKKRVFCGSADDGIIVNSGQELSFEQQFEPPSVDDDEFPEDFDPESLILHFTERFCEQPIGSDEFDFLVETWRVPRCTIFRTTLPKHEVRSAPKPHRPSVFEAWKKEMLRTVPRDELIYRIKRLIILLATAAIVFLVIYFVRGR